MSDPTQQPVPVNDPTAPDHAAPAAPSWLAQVRKLIVLIITVASTAATGITLPAPWDVIVPAVLGIAGAIVHYYVPNAAKPPTS